MTEDDKKNLPALADDNAEDQVLDKATQALIKAEAVVAALNANLPDSEHLPPIPKEYVLKAYDREAVAASMHAVFYMLGGASGYAGWALKNQTKFYEQYTKLLNAQTATAGAAGVAINIMSAIPETPQDFIEINENGKAIDGLTGGELLEEYEDSDEAEDDE